ncbi:MAG: carbohydrate ABC transporter permease [Planctomycetota bacterium]|jgi:multiple sugar transport system permease protein|nr:carbohydrate ABC transporter permease [Planctomycetota bacterium]
MSRKIGASGSLGRDRLAVRLLTLHVPMLLIILFALAPYLWMFLTSITPTVEINRMRILGGSPTIDHYVKLFTRVNFLSNMANSLVVAAGTVAAGLVLSVSAAYAFSRFRFRGRSYLMRQFLVVNMFPVVLLLIPLFIIMRQAGLIDTYWAIIISHSTFAIPFSTWMMTGYMDAIPRELDEAAMIDGCTRPGTLLRVVLPLCAPGVVATGIYLFITSWNEYLYAATLAGGQLKTITVAIQSLIGEYEIEWGLLTAGGFIGSLPATILFLIVQRRLVSGLTQGAVKG